MTAPDGMRRLQTVLVVLVLVLDLAATVTACFGAGPAWAVFSLLSANAVTIVGLRWGKS